MAAGSNPRPAVYPLRVLGLDEQLLQGDITHLVDWVMALLTQPVPKELRAASGSMHPLATLCHFEVWHPASRRALQPASPLLRCAHPAVRTSPDPACALPCAVCRMRPSCMTRSGRVL